jgi:predicted acetyltransferase
MATSLVKPSLDYLPEYKAALERGWSPDNIRLEKAAHEQLQKIEDDAASFVGKLDDPEAKAGPIILPDGSTVPRLPGYNRWIWDDGFCGNVNFRWQVGSNELPPHCLGHIGYAVVPWKRQQGYATRALALLLPEAKKQGLSYVLITAEPDNVPSQKVVLANGGHLVKRFDKLAAYGGDESLLYRINL